MDDHTTGESSADAQTICAVLRGPDRALVTVAGALDIDTAGRLKAILRGLCAAGALYVVVDLAEVTSCTPQAEAVFTSTRRRLALQLGWLLVLTPPPELAGLDTASLIDLFAAYRLATALRGELLTAPA
ncbi:MAG: anti-sigma factor antagonist [Pseudonocardia sp.]|jgi:anti-anti-sigma regulatory factor|nr:anti-sigma factor antagonist [Pseudonocardia sp.]